MLLYGETSKYVHSDEVNNCGNGSLFTVLPATVMVNSEENEMSSEFLFSSCKMMGRKQGAPQDPEGVERGVPLLETPHFTTRK